jgi:hypothetical protein
MVPPRLVSMLLACLLGAAWGALAGSRGWRTLVSQGRGAAVASWGTAALALFLLDSLLFAWFGA